MTDLLPCPFCGSSATLFASSDHSTAWEGGCSAETGCPTSPNVWELTEAEAIAAWNRRAPVAQPSQARGLDGSPSSYRARPSDPDLSPALVKDLSASASPATKEQQ